MQNISIAQRKYLKAIYELSLINPTVRTTDIASRLGISKPSVNKAVAHLKAKGFVTHKPYGAITLTDYGLTASVDNRIKSMTVKKFLISALSLTEADAECEARSIAANLSYGTLEKMRCFVEV